jgi:hypothetical protein
VLNYACVLRFLVGSGRKGGRCRRAQSVSPDCINTWLRVVICSPQLDAFNTDAGMQFEAGIGGNPMPNRRDGISYYPPPGPLSVMASISLLLGSLRRSQRKRRERTTARLSENTSSSYTVMYSKYEQAKPMQRMNKYKIRHAPNSVLS